MKKFISVALGFLMCFGLAACNNTPSGPKKVDLLVWASIDQQDYLQALIDEFTEAKKEEYNYNIDLRIVSEPECKQQLADINTAADLFAFPSDQITEFYQKGYLYEITRNKQTIIDANLEGSITGATFKKSNGQTGLFAYPVSESNTYFLYYDKSILDENDVKSMDGILAKLRTYNTGKAQAQQKMLYYDMGNAYYSVIYFFGNGCKFEQVLGGPVNTDIDSEAGQQAAKAMLDLVAKGGNELYTESESNAITKLNEGNIAAFISGTWRIPEISAKFGANMGVAPLPTDKIGGVEKALKPFMGCKYYGVNAYAPISRASHAMDLAEFITGEYGQLARFDAIGEVPSNKAALAASKVQNNEIAQVIINQRSNTVPQYNVPNMWAPLGTFASEIATRVITEATYVASLNLLAASIRSSTFD